MQHQGGPVFCATSRQDVLSMETPRMFLGQFDIRPVMLQNESGKLVTVTRLTMIYARYIEAV